MKTISRRLSRLEALQGATQALRENRVPNRPELRVIASLVGGGPPDLAKSTCTRYVTDGKLFELVRIEGEPNELTDDQLEQFIGSFPVAFTC